MKTFKQIIDDFLNGATRGIEGTDEHKHAKLVIDGDFLIWITAEKTYIVAIRLAENVIVKTTSWEILTNGSGISYLNKRAKATGTCAIRLSLPALENSDVDAKYNDLKERTKEHIETLLLNTDAREAVQHTNNDAFRVYLKKLKAKDQAQKDRDALQLSVRILAVFEQEQITENHLFKNDNLNMIIRSTNRARIVLERMDKYIQVLITLPEIISSPKENIPRPDEHPGGDDSGLTLSN